ncbi:Os01g0944400 [Oryza sativa Japonica Group]|uniref:Os01g0944400 protein n=1 Tax=Oryza sativa subsp. japonica TaxID=39947 RepID=C7IX63_ORYSJ|nr:Os01g0944400 [Oryza sativa Japonica Group]|eukprot:NP_001172738.1 Os01g0944400 [Oryza sativa Japonica Group]
MAKHGVASILTLALVLGVLAVTPKGGIDFYVRSFYPSGSVRL